MSYLHWIGLECWLVFQRRSELCRWILRFLLGWFPPWKLSRIQSHANSWEQSDAVRTSDWIRKRWSPERSLRSTRPSPEKSGSGAFPQRPNRWGIASWVWVRWSRQLGRSPNEMQTWDHISFQTPCRPCAAPIRLGANSPRKGSAWGLWINWL